MPPDEVVDRMTHAVVRVAECLVDPEMTQDNVDGWNDSLNAWWERLEGVSSPPPFA